MGTLLSTREPQSTAQVTDSSEVSDTSDRQIVLSGPQQAALEWLVNGGTIVEAAQVAGVSRRSVSRWLNDDADFQTVYAQWRTEAIKSAEARLTAAADAAVDNVISAVRDDHNLRASQFLLRQMKVGSGK